MNKKILTGAMLLAGMVMSANAQVYLEPDTTPAQNTTVVTEEGVAVEEPQEGIVDRSEGQGDPESSVDENGQVVPWFNNYEYAGFKFELPTGMEIEQGSSLKGTYPDGTFGISMSNVAKRGANQKLAYEVTRRMAQDLHLSQPKVAKENFGKCKGAIATGMLEGQVVTILTLPYNDQEVTTVMLATPVRQAWVQHFLRTLKR